MMILPLLSCLPAILVGAWAAHLNGVSYLAFLPNLVALAFGILFSAFTGRRLQANHHQSGIIAASLALGVVACSFLSPGIEGVHRWIKIGPLFLNASMAFSPLILYGIAVAARKGIALPAGLAIATSALHILQPDAGQAIAFAVGAIAIFLLTPGIARSYRVLVSGALSLEAVLAVHRFDPLKPVDHVERILHLITGTGPLLAGIGLLAIALLFLPLVWPPRSTLPITFASYLLAQFAVTELGNFPVPVIGAGAAGVLGWGFMVSATQRERRNR
jgi:cell division protein FtsW (lipid II flippase)